MGAVIGWLDPGTVRGEFAASLVRLSQYSTARQELDGTLRLQSGPRIEDARCLLTEMFLTSPSEWLLMVDSDMTFPHDSLQRLLEVADPTTAPVVGGLCYGFTAELGAFPTMYRWGSLGTHIIHDYPPDPVLYPVDATGAAFLLIHRDVFEKYRVDGPLPWWRRSIHKDCAHEAAETCDPDCTPAVLVGEDITFCIWLRQEGVPIHVLTSLEIGHVKAFTWNRASYTEARAANPPLWVPDQDPLLVGGRPDA